MRKVTIGLLLVLLLLVAGVAAAAPFPETIPLPDNFNPEGVTMGYGSHIYAGSLATGAIYRADVRTGAGEVVVEPVAGRQALGMDFDLGTGYLYVAGGPTGMAYVYDTTTEPFTLVTALTLATTGPTFVNDVVVTQEAAFFTESKASVLYRVDLADWSVTAMTLAAPFPFNPDPNAFNSNGIVATPGERWLVLAHSASGTLWRVDPATGAVMQIDLGGVLLPAADGLVRVGNRVYAVQNVLNQISEVQVAADYLSGERVDVITDSALDIPTTADAFGNALYAVNARFGQGATTFDIVRVQR